MVLLIGRVGARVRALLLLRERYPFGRFSTFDSIHCYGFIMFGTLDACVFRVEKDWNETSLFVHHISKLLLS